MSGGSSPRHQGRAGERPLVDHLEEVPRFEEGERGEAEVVEDEKLRLGETVHEGRVAPVPLGQRQLGEERRETEVAGPEILATDGVLERTGHVGLAHPGGTEDEEVLVVADEGAGGERTHERPVKTPGRRVVEIFRAGGEPELRLSEESLEHPVPPPGPLLIDQEPQVRAAIEGFVTAYNPTAEPFQWSKREVKNTPLKKKYAELCR